MQRVIYQAPDEKELMPFYIRGVGLEYDEIDMVRPEGFYRPQFILISSGGGTLEIAGQVFPLQAGSVMYIPRDIGHAYRTNTGTWKTWWVILDGEYMPQLLDRFGFTEPCVMDAKETVTLKRCMQVMYDDLMYDKLMGQYRCSAALYTFMTEVAALKNSVKLLNKHSGGSLKKVAMYMDTHYAEQITLDLLAKEADLSKEYLCRLFKQHFHMPPIAYLNRLRIQKAKVFLIKKHISIDEVARSCGFDSSSYFSKRFREIEGITPSAYRGESGKEQKASS